MIICTHLVHAQDIETHFAYTIGSLDISVNKPLSKGDTIYDFKLFGYRIAPSIDSKRALRLANHISNIGVSDKENGLDILSLSGFGTQSNFQHILDSLSKIRKYKYILAKANTDGYINNAILYKSDQDLNIKILQTQTHFFNIDFHTAFYKIPASILEVKMSVMADTITLFSYYIPYNVYNDSIGEYITTQFKTKQIDLLDTLYKYTPYTQHLIIDNIQPPLPKALLDLYVPIDSIHPHILPVVASTLDTINGKIIQKSSTKPPVNITNHLYSYNTLYKAINNELKLPENNTRPRIYDFIYASDRCYTRGNDYWHPLKYVIETTTELDRASKSPTNITGVSNNKSVILPCTNCGTRYASYIVMIKNFNSK